MPENPRIVATCAVRSLDAITEPLARAILDHHKPDEYDWRGSQTVYCEGCDMGCSCEAATWPCSTVRLIADRYGIDMPDEWVWADALKEGRHA